MPAKINISRNLFPISNVHNFIISNIRFSRGGVYLRRPVGGAARAADGLQGEKDAKLAQNLGQLQPFLAVLSKECMGQFASFGHGTRGVLPRATALGRGPPAQQLVCKLKLDRGEPMPGITAARAARLTALGFAWGPSDSPQKKWKAVAADVAPGGRAAAANGTLAMRLGGGTAPAAKLAAVGRWGRGGRRSAGGRFRVGPWSNGRYRPTPS